MKNIFILSLSLMLFSTKIFGIEVHYDYKCEEIEIYDSESDDVLAGPEDFNVQGSFVAKMDLDESDKTLFGEFNRKTQVFKLSDESESYLDITGVIMVHLQKVHDGSSKYDLTKSTQEFELYASIVDKKTGIFSENVTERMLDGNPIYDNSGAYVVNNESISLRRGRIKRGEIDFLNFADIECSTVIAKIVE